MQGRKKIEIRKWNTSFRGPFLIHASGNIDEEAMKKYGYKEEDLSRQAIVGKATLEEVKHYKDEEEFKKDRDKHLAAWDLGSYGFILGKVETIKEIKNVKGALGFWDYPI
ncbi:hypothetical protein A3K73_05185 [Candidatus Pacearchaeota archaeon RBG_13_36_9]|nr:MAG: hypothetical protein A3K73_05185 [Candidatus Pacearchaeota archaeon RBG_13_36_9]